MSEFILTIAKCSVEEMIYFFCDIVIISTFLSAFISFVSWAVWYVVRAFRAILSK